MESTTPSTRQPAGAEPPRASVIITTYNNPRYLELVLTGYARQTRTDFEIVVADDGSTDETRELLESLSARGYPVPIVHAWQPDEGYRQARAMNLAVLHSRAPWLIFTDGDCVPPADMVERHLAVQAPRTLVAGGHIRLTEEESRGIDVEFVASGRHESLVRPPHRRAMWGMHLRNQLYLALGHPRKPKIWGLNMAMSRQLLDEVNGFDLAFEGAANQDSDLRNRVRRLGGRGRCIWHRSIPVHLWHPSHRGNRGWDGARAYAKRPDMQPRAPRGLAELAEELALEATAR